MIQLLLTLPFDLSVRLVLVTFRSNMCPSTGFTAAQSPSPENQALTIWTIVLRDVML